MADHVDLWAQNTAVNLRRFRDLPSVESFRDRGRDKAVIVCGAGPSLADALEVLRERNPTTTILIAVNSAVKFLVENRVKIDYALAVDGARENIIDHLAPKHLRDFPVILASNCHPDVIEQCQEKAFVASCLGGVLSFWQRCRLMRRWGLPFISGGNAFNAGVHIARHVFDARTFMFCGADLSQTEQYYIDKPSFNDDQLLFHVKHPGGKFWTNVPLYTYKLWLENFCESHRHDCVFMNCSGGILGWDDDKPLPYIQQRPLPEALALWEEACTEFKDVALREKHKYDLAYTSDRQDYLPTCAIELWSQLIQKGAAVTYQRALDIGCGPGFGIKIARMAGLEAYGCDIANLRSFWHENGVEDYCDIAPAHKLPFNDMAFDLIVCSEVLEHIPEELVDASLKEMARICNGHAVFTIAMTRVRGAKIDGRIEPHATIRPAAWWEARMHDAGFDILRKSTTRVKWKPFNTLYRTNGCAYTLVKRNAKTIPITPEAKLGYCWEENMGEKVNALN